MPQELTLRPAGLATDPSPHGSVPDGALRDATNVVIDRDGLIQPRPGFKDATQSINTGTTVHARYAIPFAGDVYIWGYNPGNQTWDVTSYDGSVIYALNQDEKIGPPDADRLRGKGAEARGNLYCTTGLGIYKSEGASLTLTAAGWTKGPDLFAASNTTLGGWFTTGKSVAYRTTIRRKDANDYTIVSPPGARFEVTNSSGASKGLKLSIGSDERWKAGDVVEFWRSLIATGTPDAELYLAHTYTVTAAVAGSNTIVTTVDDTSENALGAALYTNPSQEGLANGNYQPPLAHDVASFADSVFYARTALKHETEHELGETGVNNAPLAMTYGTFTATVTSASATISYSGRDIGYFTVNQAIQVAGIPGTARILSVSGTTSGTMVLSVTATSTQNGVTGVFRDWFALYDATSSITIGTVWAQATKCYAGSATSTGYFKVSAALGGDGEPEDVVAAYNLLGTAYEVESVDDRSLRFRERVHGGSSFVVVSNREHAFEPPPRVYSSDSGSTKDETGKVSAAQTDPGALYWSKAHLPEAVPLLNFTYVGDRQKKIERIIPTRDALWIFKEDGLFRLTGAGADAGWRVDPVDPAFRLLGPDSCAVMDERIYCLSNYGVVSVGDGGLEHLSEPFIGKDLAAYQRNLQQNPGTAHVPSGLADIGADRYVLAVGNAGASTTTLSTAAEVFVWSTKTRTWVQWDRDVPLGNSSLGPVQMFYDPASQTMMELHSTTTADGTQFRLYQERKGDTYDSADETYSISITATGSANLTWVDTNTIVSWAPTVGDLVSSSDGDFWVTAVNGTLISLGGSIVSTKPGTAWRAVECTFEWTAKTAKNPAAVKRWQDGELLMEEPVGRDFQVRLRSDTNSTSASQTITMGLLGVAWPLPLRFWVNRAYNWSTQLFVKVRTRSVASDFVCSGLSLMYEAVSSRVRRSYG